MPIRYNERTGEFEEDFSQKSKDRIGDNSQCSDSESLSGRIVWEIVKLVSFVALGCVFAYFNYDGESFWGSPDSFVGIFTGVILWLVIR